LEKILKLNSNEEAIALYGSLDENLRYAEKEFHVRISARNHRLRIAGDKDNVEKAVRFFHTKLKEMREGFLPKKSDIEINAEAPREKEMNGGGSGAIRFFIAGA